MRKKLHLLAGAAVLAAGAIAAATPTEAAGIKAGVLTCHVSSGWGFVFGSTKDVSCSYVPDKNGGEHYAGTISKYGVDIGYTEGSVLVWTVVAPTSELEPGVLEGEYGGVTAGASIGVGASANALIGGFDKSITLQPLSIEGSTGLNVAAGIGAISLKYQP